MLFINEMCEREKIGNSMVVQIGNESFLLNSTATLIYECLLHGKDIDHIVEEICKNSSLPNNEDMSAMVETTLLEMKNLGFIKDSY